MSSTGNILLFAFLDLQTDFIEPATAFAAVGLQRALGLLLRQGVAGAIGAVIDAPGDDGTVRIALQENDNHFWPMRGMYIAPQPAPTQAWLRRIQQGNL
jgi:hypothetical protein